MCWLEPARARVGASWVAVGVVGDELLAGQARLAADRAGFGQADGLGDDDGAAALVDGAVPAGSC